MGYRQARLIVPKGGSIPMARGKIVGGERGDRDSTGRPVMRGFVIRKQKLLTIAKRADAFSK